MLLEQFLLEQFDLGVLEAGRPDLVRERLLAGLPARIQQRLSAGNAGQLILKPPPAGDRPYPKYVLAAALHSFEPVGADAQCSALVVVWFGNEVPVDLLGALRAVVQQVDWEAHALDGWY